MNGFLQQLQFLRPGWNDLIEIVIVFLLVYRLLLLIRETRAMQMLLGVLLLAGLYLLSVILDLSLIRRLIEALFQYGAIAALVVFQPEMRAALARLGQSRLVSMLGSTREARIVDRLVEGAEQLSRSGVGAILAVAGAIVGEFVASQRGLGNLMIQVQSTLDTAGMFMAVILISVVGVVLYGLVLILERIVVVRDARVE